MHCTVHIAHIKHKKVLENILNTTRGWTWAVRAWALFYYKIYIYYQKKNSHYVQSVYIHFTMRCPTSSFISLHNFKLLTCLVGPWRDDHLLVVTCIKCRKLDEILGLPFDLYLYFLKIIILVDIYKIYHDWR